MLATLLALAAGFTVVSAQPAHAAVVTFTIDGITYSADDANSAAGATVTDYDPAVGGHEVVIPDTVSYLSQDYAVTTIGTRGFENNALISVDIPDTVTTIGNNAFHGNALTHVTIPNSVITIDDWAFYVNDLTSVTIGNSVTTIGNNAFYGNDLTSLVIPDSVTTIGNLAFYRNNLTSLVIPNSVTTIGMQAFYDNDLTSLTIGESVTSIGMIAFDENAQLTEVVFEGDAPGITVVANLGPFGPAAGKTLYYFPGAIGFDTGHWQEYGTAVPITVTFDAHGGSGSMPPQAMAPTTPLIANTFTREGYFFIGWNTEADGTGDTYTDGADYSFTDDVTLYAQWAINTYTVTYDTGDGTDVSPATVEHGQILTAPTTPTREGYTFTGWYTDLDTTVDFDFDTPIVDDITLYAGWNINTYTVTYNTGEGPAVLTEGVNHGDLLTAPTTPTREGYTFTGWYTDLDTTVDFDFDTPIVDDITLYAQWAINTYTVTFDTGEGSPVLAEGAEHGDLLTAPANPTREGYTFTGWYPNQDAIVSFDFATPITEDLTLYAGWEAVVVPITVGDDTTATDTESGDQLAATGGTPNTPALLVAALAITAGAGLLLYRRWGASTGAGEA